MKKNKLLFQACDLKLKFSYFIILAVLFLLFLQGDLYHTVMSSYAYLDGHFLDFYEVNLSRVGGNDYLPLMYVFFALWNLPLYLLGVNIDLNINGWEKVPLALIFWSKFLIVVFFYFTCLVINRIALIIQVDDSSKTVTWLFVTAPLAIFAIFIMGQYDIFGLYFTMLGVLFLLRKNNLAFALCFSFAISFKYFALAPFVPLLLLVEKNINKVIGYILLSLLVTFIQFAIYSNSDIFLDSVFKLAFNRISYQSSPGVPVFKIMAVVCYSSICLYAFFKNLVNDKDLHFFVIVIPLLVYAVVFSYVPWHPQWLLIISPFMALGFILANNKYIYLGLDFLLGVAFILIVISRWSFAVDATMLHLGVLRDILEPFHLRNNDLFPALIPVVAVYVFYFCLIAMPLMLFFYRKNENNSNIIVGLRFFTIRSFAVTIFIVTSMLCVIAPMAIVIKYYPSAKLNYSKTVISSENLVSVGEIVIGSEFIQSFKAERDGLIAVSPYFATGARVNKCHLEIEILDDKGDILVSKNISVEGIGDNSRYNIYFPRVDKSAGMLFGLKIYSRDCVGGNAITAWRTKEDVYNGGNLTHNRVLLAGDLDLIIYYH